MVHIHNEIEFTLKMGIKLSYKPQQRDLENMLSLICQKQKDKYLWCYLHELSEMGGFVREKICCKDLRPGKRRQ